MVEALAEKKYDVNFTWGIGTHSNKQGGAIMPDMLRWLWRDYPRPDDPQDDSNRKLLVPVADATALNKRDQKADDERVPDDVTIQYNVRYREGTVNNWTLDLAMPKERSDKPRPAIVIIHGGGWILGDFPTHERFVRDIVADSGFTAVFVNYTPSPEAKYPTAINEIHAAAKWVAAHGAEIRVDANRLAIFGNSVGGNMTAAVALKALHEGGPKFKCQIML